MLLGFAVTPRNHELEGALPFLRLLQKGWALTTKRHPISALLFPLPRHPEPAVGEGSLFQLPTSNPYFLIFNGAPALLRFFAELARSTDFHARANTRPLLN